MIKLNLGCQVHYFEGWVNQDVVGDDPNMKVDLVCNAIELPYEDNTVDFIYAGHLVEHFFPDTLGQAIKEWHRVLKQNGTLVVVTPDCGSVFRDYSSGKFDSIESTWQQIFGRIYHYDRDSERHHIAFDWEQLLKMCKVVEWTDAEKFNFMVPPSDLSPFMDSHISRGAYQLGIILKK